MTTARMAYRQYLNSPRWRALRSLRKRLDGGRCRICGTRKHLEVHHITYANRGGSFWRELLDLTTLCSAHHRMAHVDD
jgi:5-methylcytosine-specific restriction endonuclease McrA